MSATSPADPTRAYVTPRGDAPVISLTAYRRGPNGPGEPPTGRRNRMDTPHPDQPDRPDQRTAAAAFAEDIEMSFNRDRMSLTNQDTAAAYRRTLDVWEHILKGCRARDVIDDRQFGELVEVLKGMRQAPDLI